MSRVRIGTCSGLADAAVVRAALEAHDIPVVINAEQHASMLGGLGGSFVPLHIFVDDSDAEDAAAILAKMRDHGGAGEELDEDEPIDVEAEAAPDFEDEDDDRDEDDDDDDETRTTRTTTR